MFASLVNFRRGTMTRPNELAKIIPKMESGKLSLTLGYTTH